MAKKPPASTEKHSEHRDRVDPFENPEETLLIDKIPHDEATHLLVLNKYPIIPNHFILATSESKAQTNLLEQDDLWLTYQCLKQWKAGTDSDAADELFAFFNSGEHSGASQSHRHLQLLSQLDMRHGMRGDNWSLLADEFIHEKQHDYGKKTE